MHECQISEKLGRHLSLLCHPYHLCLKISQSVQKWSLIENSFGIDKFSLFSQNYLVLIKNIYYFQNG